MTNCPENLLVVGRSCMGAAASALNRLGKGEAGDVGSVLRWPLSVSVTVLGAESLAPGYRWSDNRPSSLLVCSCAAVWFLCVPSAGSSLTARVTHASISARTVPNPRQVYRDSALKSRPHLATSARPSQPRRPPSYGGKSLDCHLSSNQMI